MELLTVIAVIGILASILIPVVGGVQASAKKAKTRVQFSQWAAAIEGFRQEYGYYPDWRTAPSATVLFENGIIDDASDAERFVQALSGKSVDGSAPTLLSGNTKRIAFCSFGQDDIKSDGKLQDAFELPSPQIVVLMDLNYDGIVKTDGTDSSPVPLFAQNPVPPEGVRAGVIFYSSGAGESASDIVKSWE